MQNKAERSAEYIFQGTMYFYRPYKIQCRYQYTLHEAVDPALMQQALTGAVARAPYFAQRLVWEKGEAFLEPNPAPCRLRLGSAMPEMPEQTDGYLFSVSCEGATVFIDWNHFIADGHGIARLIVLLLQLYWNLRYGAGFACAPLVCSPAYDVAALLAHAPGPRAESLQSDALQTFEGTPHRSLIRITKRSLVQAAAPCGAKPFCALLALLSEGVGLYLGKEQVRYAYSTDTRAEAGVPDAAYNCVASFQHDVRFGPDTRLQDVLPGVDAAVRAALAPESKLHRMAEQMGWIYKVSQQKAPLKIKQRIFQMGEYISCVPADFWLSYLGSPLEPGARALEPYIREFQVWVPPDGASIGFEAASLNGEITLCVQNKADAPGLTEALRTVFAREGLTVLEAREL